MRHYLLSSSELSEIIRKDGILADQKVAMALELQEYRKIYGALGCQYLETPEVATCQVEHDHWEGKMVCGNPLPCRTHGGGRW